MKSLDELFEEEEATRLEQARKDIAAENADPAFRAALEQRLAEMEERAEAECCDEDEDEDEPEDDEENDDD